MDCVRRPDLFGNTTDSALVEEFIDGPEYALNFFFCGTRATFVDTWRYTKEERSNCGPIYRSMIQADPEALAGTGLVPYALMACRAVGVRLGPAHVEVKLGPHGPVLMEVGARLSGARIPELWERYSDFDPFATTLSIYLGETVRMPDRVTFSKRLGIAFCPIGEREAGEVVAIEGLTEIQRLASFVDAALSVRVGAYAEPTRDLETLAGMVHLASDRPEVLLHDINAVHCTFRVVTRAVRGHEQCVL